MLDFSSAQPHPARTDRTLGADSVVRRIRETTKPQSPWSAITPGGRAALRLLVAFCSEYLRLPGAGARGPPALVIILERGKRLLGAPSDTGEAGSYRFPEAPAERYGRIPGCGAVGKRRRRS